MCIRDELYEHIVKHYLKGEVPTGFDDNFDLIASGILDSLALFDLLAHIEKTYGVTFGEHDIVLDHFESIDGVERFINSKLTAERVLVG